MEIDLGNFEHIIFYIFYSIFKFFSLVTRQSWEYFLFFTFFILLPGYLTYLMGGKKMWFLFWLSIILGFFLRPYLSNLPIYGSKMMNVFGSFIHVDFKSMSVYIFIYLPLIIVFFVSGRSKRKDLFSTHSKVIFSLIFLKIFFVCTITLFSVDTQKVKLGRPEAIISKNLK